MSLRIFYSPIFREHRPEGYHPENPTRLDYAIKGLRECGFWKEDNVLEPEPVTAEEVLLIHDGEYVGKIRELGRAFGYLDPDTYVSPGTWEAALTALGAARDAVKSALKRPGMYLALVRPPGHHAGRSGKAFNASTLGFCIFNNSAFAARTLKELGGTALVIDFDAHHGNGTQEIFWNDPDVIHIDIHERDIYPWSGYEHDVGGRDAEGSKINIPMPHYATDDDYLLAWMEVVLPLIEEVNPNVVVVSAGFDGFQGELLTTLRLTERFFRYAGATLSRYSLAVIFEGGYNVGLMEGLPAFIEGYLSGEPEKGPLKPSYEALSTVQRVVTVHREWWEL
ncbi:histone deacetylase family protein [Thermococcus sp. ES12]|uniref:histone deacetylase family protein n=1 Tax=Thermococcus sp. ES12 TaxID=1638246 RepID=UPI00143224A3|nr:histone deacetylase family protein [Thermococcus sp. ES12]NJE76297.1 histone deacetylase family protein [Thermococcus sp. ES12]